MSLPATSRSSINLSRRRGQGQIAVRRFRNRNRAARLTTLLLLVLPNFCRNAAPHKCDDCASRRPHSLGGTPVSSLNRRPYEFPGLVVSQSES
jgi:hypothetical protein